MEKLYEIKEMPERYALIIHRTLPLSELPQAIGESYHALAGYLAQLGEQACDVPFTAYHNMDMERLEVDMGFPTLLPLPGNDRIQTITLPAGQVATGMYKGSYSRMEPFYKAMAEWVASQGGEPTGLAFEYYYNSPQDVPESELLTRVEWPLKPHALQDE